MIFIMNIEIDKLASVMGLTQYQTNVLKARPDVYNIRRLVKRGSVLYAPRSIHGVVGFVRRMFYGRPADLIGRDKMLVCNQCGIRFLHMDFIVCQSDLSVIMPMIMAILLHVRKNNILKLVVCANKITHVCRIKIGHYFRQRVCACAIRCNN